MCFLSILHGEIWKRIIFTLKTHRMFFVHNTPQKFENVTINGHFGFDLKTTWLPWSYRFRKAYFFKMSFVQTTTQSSDSWASGLGSSPGWRHRVVFLARHFTLTAPLSTQLYKWVPANSWRNLKNFGWLTCDGLASRPWGSRITSSRLMLRGSVLLNYLKIPRQS